LKSREKPPLLKGGGSAKHWRRVLRKIFTKRCKKHYPLIEILNKKANSTYHELALLTGYHPKSLARISSMIKRNRYDLIDNKRSELNRSIIADYLDSSCKTYKEFYSLNSFKYGVSYSTLCKVLKDAKDKREAVLIKKIKTNRYAECMI